MSFLSRNLFYLSQSASGIQPIILVFFILILVTENHNSLINIAKMKASYISLFVLMVSRCMASSAPSKYASKFNIHETFISDAVGSKSSRLTRRIYMPEEEELTPQAAWVRDKMECFIEELKYFVRDTSFDYESFEAKSIDLKLHLSKVEVEVADLPFTYSISKQLVYAKDVYDVMLLSAQIASFYCHKTHEQTLLRKLVQLNMGLICFQDSHGDPNTEMEGYAETVHRLTRVVKYMGELYEQVTNVSIEVRKNLQVQLEKAKNNLHVLSLPIRFPEVPIYYMGEARAS